MPGVPARQTHDYIRNGPTNLCAAVDIASGQVIGEMAPQHRAEEFRRFLNRIDKSVPAHLACMSCSTTPRPTRHHRSSAGLFDTRASRSTSHRPTTPGPNLVERWFAELTTKWIKRNAHRSVRDPVASLRTWISDWNDNPKPQTRASTASPPTASGSTTQATRRYGLPGASLVSWRGLPSARGRR
jgi:hypothetical protein